MVQNNLMGIQVSRIQFSSATVLHNRNEFEVEIEMKHEMTGKNWEKGMNSLNVIKSGSVLGRFQTLTIYEFENTENSKFFWHHIQPEFSSDWEDMALLLLHDIYRIFHFSSWIIRTFKYG
jgi:hypothetical protein